MRDAMAEILEQVAAWPLSEEDEQDVAECVAWLAGERVLDRWADDGGRDVPLEDARDGG